MSLPPVLQQLRQRASANRRRVILPEVGDERIRDAAERLSREGLVEVVSIPDPKSDPRFDEVTAHIHERRKHAGIELDGARELAGDPLYFATSLVALGHADAGVAGALYPTAEVIRAAIHCVGQPQGCDFVSSMFLMVRDKEVLSFTDCSVIPDPDEEQLASIARTTARHHRSLTGEEPRVAFLSYSTKGSALHPLIDKVRTAAEMFKELEPEIPADGELQFDTAYVPDVARRKAPRSEVGGRANVFVFPDLNSGNIAYKITERLGGFSAFGPVMQGLRRPFLDLSRGCSTDDAINVAVIAAVLASEIAER